MTNCIPDNEAFENGYLHWIEALRILSMPPARQCEAMGDYNVPWELKRDVLAGRYLFQGPHADLTSEQQQAIGELFAALDAVPEAVPPPAGCRDYISLMEHPCWQVLRVKSAALLTLLVPITERNARFFTSGSE